MFFKTRKREDVNEKKELVGIKTEKCLLMVVLVQQMKINLFLMASRNIMVPE